MQQTAPTCIHESDLTPELDSAGRGGQAAGPFAPQAHDQADEAPAIGLALADDQADEAPATGLVLADDQADNLSPRDELVCGVEIAGPAGALVVVGGAAYVPSGAEPWYAAICAAIAPPPGEHSDDQAEIAQLLVPLDTGERAELATEAGQGQADEQAESVQPASVPVAATKTNRTAPKWVRELHAYMQRLALMSGSELAGELRKWHNTEKKLGRAAWITGRIKAVEREIERRDLLGGSTSDQAGAPDSDDQADLSSPDEGPQAPAGERTGADLPPPTCSSGLGVGAGATVGPWRRGWRSPVVRCDWEPEPFVPKEALRRMHPIADLGTNPESMRAAHEYCERILAGLGEECVITSAI